MKNIFAIPLVTFSSYGWAQQLAQVQPQNDSTFGLFVLGLVALGGGLVYLKLKRPETFARLLGVAKKVEHEAVDAYHTVSTHAPSPGAPPNAIERANFGPAPGAEQGPGIHPLDAKIASLQAQIAALQPPPRDPREDQIAELEAQLAALKPAEPPKPAPEEVAALQAQLDAFRLKYPGYIVGDTQNGHSG